MHGIQLCAHQLSIRWYSEKLEQAFQDEGLGARDFYVSQFPNLHNALVNFSPTHTLIWTDNLDRAFTSNDNKNRNSTRRVICDSTQWPNTRWEFTYRSHTLPIFIRRRSSWRMGILFWNSSNAHVAPITAATSVEFPKFCSGK